MGKLVASFNNCVVSFFLSIGVMLLVFKMFGNIPDADRLMREASLLDIYLFKRLRVLVEHFL